MLQENSVISAYGVRMPKIIYGTAWKKEHTADYVKQALTLGFRGIDTACQPKHYHENGVGEGIAACLKNGQLSREELYVQSKFTSLNGQDPQRIPYDANATIAEQVKQSLQVSLKNLRTSYLDGLVLHSPMAIFSQTLEVWRAMAALYQTGQVKQLGISNCYELALLERLYETVDIKPAVLQNRFYADTNYDKKLREFCRQHNIIYQSFWTLTANPQILSNVKVGNLAATYQRSPAQVFFRYLIQIGIMPLTGTTSPIHMQQDLAVFDFNLTDEECGEIESLLNH